MTRPVLDWRSHHDPASLDYPIRPLLAGARPRSYTWACGAWNDQGREGACVGFAWSHELAARPVVLPTSAAEAQRLYRRAQQLDEWPGERYEGTSVLAGAKAVREVGGLVEFRWAFSLDDLARAVGHTGPAVLGIPWRDGMWDVDADGYVRATGEVVGGHAILCRGVNFRGRYFTLRNSWGRDWGRNGDCRITFDDLGQLLADQGEACIPVPAPVTVLLGVPRTLDVDGARCYFESNGCTAALIGAGGLDEHHAWPAFLGGPGGSADTPACPNHHRRQHSLLRYLVECDGRGAPAAWLVLQHFTAIERRTALAAVARWVAAGRPPVRGWNVPAARHA